MGQKVSFRPGTADLSHLRSSYAIVRLLPSKAGDLQYQVKSDRDAHDRVVLKANLLPR